MKKKQSKGTSLALPTVHPDMLVSEIITLCPTAESLLANYGLHCFHCSANAFETLRDGCLSHGFDDEDVRLLVDDLNELIKEAPVRPQVINITLPAAKAIRSIAEAEGKPKDVLVVTADAQGGFCLEFKPEPERDAKRFSHPEEPSVSICASPSTLFRIGGATIDFRDNRLKLDLPEDVSTECGCGGECGCSNRASSE